MLIQNRFFDTRIDTNKFFVPMTIHFKKRNYINKDGLSPIYLHVTSKDRRKRMPLDIYVDPKKWDSKKRRLSGNDEVSRETNLYLDIVWSKITNIRKQYKLCSKPLTIDSFLFEFQNDMPTTDFIQFFKAMLKDRKSTIRSSTYDKEMAIVRKLERFKKTIMFYEIDELFFMKFRNWLADEGNNKATRNGNVKIIKKYLRYAIKAGVKLPVALEDIKAGPTSGQKSYLTRSEVKKLHDYFFSSIIPQNQKVCLGYFLFSCFTGLRISDVLNQKRQFLKEGEFTFVHVKTNRNQYVKLNQKATAIFNHCPELFATIYTKSHIRTVVKDICTFLQINKRVDYHMSRHTFGTNYILLGGSVTTLQLLMNHSDIREVMTYVHLAEQEKNAEADLMDGLFES